MVCVSRYAVYNLQDVVSAAMIDRPTGTLRYVAFIQRKAPDRQELCGQQVR